VLGLGRYCSFLILYTVGETPWTGISPSQGLYLHPEQHKHRTNAHNTVIHALSGIRTHDASVRASEDRSCLRPRGHCDRLGSLHTQRHRSYDVRTIHVASGSRIKSVVLAFIRDDMRHLPYDRRRAVIKREG
jgi:hypothetical protein